MIATRGIISRRWRPRRLLAVGALALAGTLVVAASGTASTPSSSTVVRATLPSGARTSGQDASYNAVSCPAVNTCVAVGSYRSSSGNQLVVDLETNGLWAPALRVVPPTGAITSSGLAPAKISELLGVSCPAPGSCVAVGTVATSSGFVPVIVTLDATTWVATTGDLPSTAASSGQSASLDAIACATLSDCTAVGTFTTTTGNQEPLAISEVAGVWSTPLSPALPSSAISSLQSASLTGVACPNASTCEAVGSYVDTNGFQPLVVRDTGGTWGAPSSAVTIGLPNDAATGDHFFDALSAISCPTATSCTAVGQYATAGGYVAMATSDVGGSWTSAVVVTSPTPAASGAVVADLQSVSCVNSGVCSAGGGYGTSGEALSWRASLAGGVWSSAPSPVPTDAVSDSTQVAATSALQCFAPVECLAVGNYVNAAGTQPFTSTPTTAPSAPSITSASSGRGSLSLTWTSPTYDGLSPITGYTATALPGGATCRTTSLSCTISPLTNGTTYHVNVVATNAVGTSTTSKASQGVTPATTPSMVTITTIAPSSTSLKVTVSAPASSGGQPITTYEYSLNGGLKWRHRTAGSTSRIIVISSLSRHHTYEVAIRAVNAVGPGAPSNVVAATTT